MDDLSDSEIPNTVLVIHMYISVLWRQIVIKKKTDFDALQFEK